MSEFEGKVALVTGTTGIGLATAKRLAAGGAAIIACGIDRNANAAMQDAFDAAKFEVLVLHVDVSVPDAVQEAVAHGVQRFGGLDIIVNSAAVHPYGTVLDTSFDTWNRAMAVNVGSIYLTAHFGIPEMVKRGGGAIVNVSSVQGFASQQNVAAYTTTKGAIHALTRAMALDHARSGIRVNSVSPGSVRTPILANAARGFGRRRRRYRGCLQTLRRGASDRADRRTGRTGRTDRLPVLRQGRVLHRRRLQSGWRADGGDRRAIATGSHGPAARDSDGPDLAPMLADRAAHQLTPDTKSRSLRPRGPRGRR